MAASLVGKASSAATDGCTKRSSRRPPSRSARQRCGAGRRVGSSSCCRSEREAHQPLGEQVRHGGQGPTCPPRVWNRRMALPASMRINDEHGPASGTCPAIPCRGLTDNVVGPGSGEEGVWLSVRWECSLPSLGPRAGREHLHRPGSSAGDSQQGSSVGRLRSNFAGATERYNVDSPAPGGCCALETRVEMPPPAENRSGQLGSHDDRFRGSAEGAIPHILITFGPGGP
jgi:hypothetical protein